MDITKIIGFALMSVVIIKLLKEHTPEFSTIVSVLFSVGFFVYISSGVLEIFDYVHSICDIAGINIAYIEIIFKVIGVAYISEFASAICKDAGESSISLKVDIAGKLTILMFSMPIFKELIGVFSQILM